MRSDTASIPDSWRWETETKQIPNRECLSFSVQSDEMRRVIESCPVHRKPTKLERGPIFLMMERLFGGVTVGRERVIRVVQSSHYSQRLEVEVERRSLRWADITHA